MLPLTFPIFFYSCLFCFYTEYYNRPPTVCLCCCSTLKWEGRYDFFSMPPSGLQFPHLGMLRDLHLWCQLGFVLVPLLSCCFEIRLWALCRSSFDPAFGLFSVTWYSALSSGGSWRGPRWWRRGPWSALSLAWTLASTLAWHHLDADLDVDILGVDLGVELLGVDLDMDLDVDLLGVELGADFVLASLIVESGGTL